MSHPGGTGAMSKHGTIMAYPQKTKKAWSKKEKNNQTQKELTKKLNPEPYIWISRYQFAPSGQQALNLPLSLVFS